MSAPTRLTIDIWSDVMCPWCAIGYGQLSRALDQLEGEIEADVRWHPFELNPDMPETGEEQSAHLTRKYRRSAEETDAVRGQMKAIADSAGVNLAWEGEGEAPPAMMWNTFAAHCLLTWALEQYGPAKQTELKLALFRAHFNQRRRIGARDVLLDVAEEVGLDRAGALAALSDPAIGARVRAEERQAWDMNVTGVPAMVVQGKFLIPGAQAPETYVTALRRVAERGL
ncbi:DsbA family oxidoreductase [Altererythrobacter sp. H2]|uniref:DsbA family oxidoreductase n=1 Tax=Altererythrobacter sp. H2 TaxID=3108391 RepID=UPI002B4C0AE7|nr:DsbA family oxidoreductase [Altererythrobacter sp. H2]WRK96839.1 DsbA family oxidoreductase [Altererythrobacter sp. H2]